MKQLFILITAVLLFSCTEKTEQTSKYKTYISEINELNNSLDSNYRIFSEINTDSLKSIMNTANEKHAKAKEVYKSDTIDSRFEEIMLTARGGVYKKMKQYLVDHGKVNDEYEYTSNQVKTLKQNLIHEKLSEEDASTFTQQEKNSMLLLNGKISELKSISDHTFNSFGKLFFQLDSIIEFHEKQ